jgi:hypothetical protein
MDVLHGIVTALSKSETTGNIGVTDRRSRAYRDIPSNTERGRLVARFRSPQCGFYRRRHTRYQPEDCTGRRSVWNAIRMTCTGGNQ